MAVQLISLKVEAQECIPDHGDCDPLENLIGTTKCCGDLLCHPIERVCEEGVVCTDEAGHHCDIFLPCCPLSGLTCTDDICQ